ncbi:TM2 domain-containing protein [Nostoc sp.]|uniref:TM2 domain-containing protein n=1 Tax=Nostoc sp. TaxID=1180 RepID=UPI002FF7B7A6
MQQANSGVAYILWCLCFFGICGGQRLYTGQIGIGLIYFFTIGFLGIGQLIDLALIPNMVDKRNLYLRGLHSNGTPSVNQSITLNIGDIPQLQQLQAIQLQAIQPQTLSTGSSMQKLLKAAKEHNGQLSLAQAAMYTELESEHLKELLQEATKIGYAEINNDPNTGAIRYHFDL